MSGTLAMRGAGDPPTKYAAELVFARWGGWQTVPAGQPPAAPLEPVLHVESLPLGAVAAPAAERAPITDRLLVDHFVGNLPALRGTCRPFPLWDHTASRPLALIEQPLVAMEASLLTRRYQGLSHDDAAERIDALRDECLRHRGTFSLLWHNNYLASERDFALYEHAAR
jgi:hypothetical protein